MSDLPPAPCTLLDLLGLLDLLDRRMRQGRPKRDVLPARLRVRRALVVLAMALWLGAIVGGCAPAVLERDRGVGVRRDITSRCPGSLVGASGLSRRGDGFVVVTEADGAVHLLEPGEEDCALRTLPVSGWPEGYEAEGVASLGRDRLLVATERAVVRSGVGGDDDDRVFEVSVRVGTGTDTAHVVAEHRVPYARFGVLPESNRGLEGICVAGSTVLVALEVTTTDLGQRFALVGRATLGAGGSLASLPGADRAGGARGTDVAGAVGAASDVETWTPGRVALETLTGKLSALTCRVASSGRIEVFAIERHFGFARLLRFEVPASGAIPDVRPTLELDLREARPDRSAAEGVPNYEGLELIERDGREVFVLLTDNYYRGRVDAPTQLVWRARPVATRLNTDTSAR